MTATDTLPPAATVALLWLVFGGAHVGLASARVRPAPGPARPAPGWVGAVCFAGLAALGPRGAWPQDGKPPARRGAPYAGYLAVPSAVPSAAIVARRQRLAWREIPPRGLVLGLAVAAALRTVHASIFAHGGAWVIGVVLAGAALSAGRAWRRAQRGAGTPPRAATRS